MTIGLACILFPNHVSPLPQLGDRLTLNLAD